MVRKAWALPTDVEQEVDPNPGGEEGRFGSYEVHRVHVISDEELEVLRDMAEWLDSEGPVHSPRNARALRAILPAPDLLPCLFCGGEAVGIVSDDRPYVECRGCGGSGPPQDNAELARREWNGAKR